AAALGGAILLQRAIPRPQNVGPMARRLALGIIAGFALIRWLGFVWHIRTYFRYPGTESYAYVDFAFAAAAWVFHGLLAWSAFIFARAYARRTRAPWLKVVAGIALLALMIAASYFLCQEFVWLFAALDHQF